MELYDSIVYDYIAVFHQTFRDTISFHKNFYLYFYGCYHVVLDADFMFMSWRHDGTNTRYTFIPVTS